jgi:hypothetical protein
MPRCLTSRIEMSDIAPDWLRQQASNWFPTALVESLVGHIACAIRLPPGPGMGGRDL